MAKQPITAELAQVLLWYDEPQIVLLKREAFRYVIAVAVEIEGHHSPFVGAEISVRQLLDYKMERVDLRYLFMRPDGRKWWVFDLDSSSSKIELKKIKSSDPLVDDSAPESGFFSRFHDEIADLDVTFANSVQKFDIDGNWDLGEFSQFYGQVSDLYYMFHSAAEFQKAGASPVRVRQIQDAFLRPFRGGGSYLALYNDFANDNDRAARLRVSGIKYHSPGYVEVRALEGPFSATLALLRSYADKYEEIKKRYNKLHKTLSHAGLLRGEPRSILSKALRDDITSQSIQLAEQMAGLSFSTYLALAGDNLVVASKVLLSIVRRVERLYQFFQEGRAKHDSVPVN